MNLYEFRQSIEQNIPLWWIAIPLAIVALLALYEGFKNGD